VSEYTYIPAPLLCLFADEDSLIKIGSVVFPGFVFREAGVNGLQMCILGDYLNNSRYKNAMDKFQIILGILRAWSPFVGERKDEQNLGLGQVASMDEYGNQVVTVGTIVEYRIDTEQFEMYLKQVDATLNLSSAIRNSFWLNGRRSRNAADYYMIYEYAKSSLNGPQNINSLLSLSSSDISNLKKSANNLCPTLGGRHAGGKIEKVWGLDEQSEFIGKLLRNWCEYEFRT
jgi:hypothetical protein